MSGEFKNQMPKTLAIIGVGLIGVYNRTLSNGKINAPGV